jgi:hypothetical protein
MIRGRLENVLQELYDAPFEVITLPDHAQLNAVIRGDAVRPRGSSGLMRSRNITPSVIVTDNMAKRSPVDSATRGLRQEYPAGLQWLATRIPKAARIPCIMFSDGDPTNLVPQLALQGVPLVSKRDSDRSYDPFIALAKQIGTALQLPLRPEISAQTRFTEREAQRPSQGPSR